MLHKSMYICETCGYKTEAPAGTLRSCFNCNTRMVEKVNIVHKVMTNEAPVETKETVIETKAPEVETAERITYKVKRKKYGKN